MENGRVGQSRAAKCVELVCTRRRRRVCELAVGNGREYFHELYLFHLS